jgi:hypothetical protein
LLDSKPAAAYERHSTKTKVPTKGLSAISCVFFKARGLVPVVRCELLFFVNSTVDLHRPTPSHTHHEAWLAVAGDVAAIEACDHDGGSMRRGPAWLVGCAPGCCDSATKDCQHKASACSLNPAVLAEAPLAAGQSRDFQRLTESFLENTSKAVPLQCKTPFSAPQGQDVEGVTKFLTAHHRRNKNAAPSFQLRRQHGARIL